MDPAVPIRFDAVVFDLLTALLDSWTVWNRAAGSAADGMHWRREYLRLTYGCGAYRPYEDLVREAADGVGLNRVHADALMTRWDELQPWPEVVPVLDALVRRGVRLGIVTNCSIGMGRRAADRVGVAFHAVVTAEEAGFYKPRPEPYRAVLARLGADPARTLFVAGSPADVPGAAGAGMPVFWHNRAGLPPATGGARPLLVADTLHPLLDLL
jgi:2-haloacid dehalogenase